MEEVGFPTAFPPGWGRLPSAVGFAEPGASCGDQPERVAENFRRFCGAVGTDADALVKNHQVHGDLVRPVTWADVLPSPGARHWEADGLVTRTPACVLTVFFRRLYPGAAVRPQEEGRRGSPRRMAGAPP